MELHAYTGQDDASIDCSDPGGAYIDRTGPGDVESTARDYSESLVRT